MIISILGMGHFRQFKLFGHLYGFELWWFVKPTRLWIKGGMCFIPWHFGIWVRDPKEDKK